MTQPIDQFPRLARLFNNVGYVPLDLPRFVPDDAELWQRLYSEQAGNVVYHPLDQSEFAVNYRKTVHFWGCVPFANVSDASITDPKRFFVTPRVHWEERFPRLWKQIQTELPFSRVDQVTLWNSKREVNGHKDKHWEVDRDYHHLMAWPSEFRIEIYSENDGSTFRIRPNAPDETGAGYMPIRNDPMADCKLPADTNSWAFRNETMVHGTRYSGRNKHLLIVQGVFDPIRVEALLARSCAKYNDYIVPADRVAFMQYLEDSREHQV